MNDTPAQEVREALERRIAEADLVRPYRPRCHDVGQTLSLDITGVWPEVSAHVELTYRCNFDCVHCYVVQPHTTGELSTAEVLDAGREGEVR